MTQVDFDELCNTLGMTEIIRLQTMLSSALIRRFERPRTLVFSDVVGSTPYFSTFGDNAGRQLQQWHIDLVQQSIEPVGGKIVDTAGDGAFICFQSVDDAMRAMVDLLRLLSVKNISRAREHRLEVRIGMHHGLVLTDDVQVSGDAVNFCARITASAGAGEIRLSKAAFLALTNTEHRLKCRPLPAIVLKGVERPADLMVLDWRDRTVWLSSIRLDTGEELLLPDQDIVTMGRLKEQDGMPGNDIVLQCAEESQTVQISRWHCELRRQSGGWVIRSVTASSTTVNGLELTKGSEWPIRPGDRVRVGNVLSLDFQGPQEQAGDQDAGRTVIVPQGSQPVQGKRPV
jgi:class 3 adenylate cyclase